MLKIFLVFCFVAMLAMVNGERPLQTVQCTTNLFMNLIGCVDFVSNGSKLTNPSIGCCGGLEKIVNEAPSCVCQAFNFAKGFGIDVNMTRAQQLPSLCEFSTDIDCAELGPPPLVPSKPSPPSHLAPPKSSSSPAPFAPVIPPAQPMNSDAMTFSTSYAVLIVSLVIVTCSHL